MNKTIFTIILIAFATAAFAQADKQPVKKDTVVQYQKFIKVPLEDYSNLVRGITQWKALILYNPNISADEKIQTMQQLENYLGVQGFQSRVKLDSAIIKQDTVSKKAVPKPVKKKK